MSGFAHIFDGLKSNPQFQSMMTAYKANGTPVNYSAGGVNVHSINQQIPGTTTSSAAIMPPQQNSALLGSSSPFLQAGNVQSGNVFSGQSLGQGISQGGMGQDQLYQMLMQLQGRM